MRQTKIKRWYGKPLIKSNLQKIEKINLDRRLNVEGAGTTDMERQRLEANEKQ